MAQALKAGGMQERTLFLGAVANADMPDIYRAADISVLPSLAEATSIAGLEAMACAVPLVGTRVGGIPTILQDGVTGLLIPPRDADALAAAIGRLARDVGLRRNLGAAARQSVELSFSWPRIAARTLAVYEGVLGEARR
jgi:glycosyltransferase involved in cell wall biosynthesis